MLLSGRASLCARKNGEPQMEVNEVDLRLEATTIAAQLLANTSEESLSKLASQVVVLADILADYIKDGISPQYEGNAYTISRGRGRPDLPRSPDPAARESRPPR